MRRLAVRFGCFGVALAAIIGFIKSAALENDGGANANFTAHFARFATWTDAVGLGHDRLELLVFLAASVADVFVGWHGGCEINLSANCARCLVGQSRVGLNGHFRGAQHCVTNAIPVLQLHADRSCGNAFNGLLQNRLMFAGLKSVAKIWLDHFNAHARQ